MQPRDTSFQFVKEQLELIYNGNLLKVLGRIMYSKTNLTRP